MSYEPSFNGKRSSNRYRGSSQERGHAFENSGSRKRFRSNGVDLSLQDMDDIVPRKSYEFYNPNDRFEADDGYNQDTRRSRPGESKYRHDREQEYGSPVKRSRGNDRAPDLNPPKPSRILGAFGLAPRTEERHLYSIMRKYGYVEEVKILRDNISTRSRGFGFIYFQSIDAARDAKSDCSKGLDLHGKKVRIDYSYTKGPYTSTPGTYLGRDKRPQNRIEMGRRSGAYENRRRSLDYDDGAFKSRSPQSFRHRRPMNESNDNFYRKHRAANNSSRSRSPVEFNNHSRERMPKSQMDVRSYRPRSNRSDELMHDMAYDVPRHSKHDLISLDHSPRSR